VPLNYAGDFTSSDAFLERLWAIGAYTTRACLCRSGAKVFLGSILVNRGDRIAFLGDAYVAQATLLAAFGSREIARDSLEYTASVGNSIKPYDVMWVLTLLDYVDWSGDVSALGGALGAKVGDVLAAARDVLVPAARGDAAALRWSRDDPRMGFGFEFADIPPAQCAYRALAAEAWRRAGASAHANASDWRAAFADARLYEGPAGWFAAPRCGMHAAADWLSAWNGTNGGGGAAVFAAWFGDDLQLASLSPFESYFVIRGLVALGTAEADAAATYLVDRQWRGMVDAGATTTWERFDPQTADAGAFPGRDLPPVNAMNDRTSMAHPWSSGATALLSRYGLGVEPTAPGFRTFDVFPRLVLPDATGTVPTPLGNIVVSLRRARGTLELNVTVPRGATGTVKFRAGDGDHAVAVDGLNVPVRGAVAASPPLVGGRTYAVRVATAARPAAPPRAPFRFPVALLGVDRATGGAWRGRHGADGHLLFNASADGRDVAALPSYVNAIVASSREDSRGGAAAERVACATNPGGFGVPGPVRGACAWTAFPDATAAAVLDGAAAPAALGPVGWQGSFHVDVDVAAGANFTVALYFADYGAWNASIFLQTRALDGLAVVAEAAVLRDFRGGAYVSFAADRSLRFRVMQLHDHDGDRDGWPPPPTLTALFFG